MKVHYPKLYNMAHHSLNVFTASKGSHIYILFAIDQNASEISRIIVFNTFDQAAPNVATLYNPKSQATFFLLD